MSSYMRADARIYVAGHRGLVGSALVRQLTAKGYRKLVLRTHSELELTNRSAVSEFFERERPEFVFLAAAKVGGIMANNSYPADFIKENLEIQTNVIHEAWRSGVKRLLFLGSSCIYPRDCPQPIKEEYLLTGPLEATNRSYALAKIAGIEMCWAYNRQYGTQYLAAMPTNLYGPGDNYDLEASHVLPAMIRKFHEAKTKRITDHGSRHSPDDAVVLWGSGTPRREFLYSDDCADACIFLMNLAQDRYQSLITNHQSRVLANGSRITDHGSPPLINIGCGEDHTIRELAELVREAVGYEGEVAWDRSKPDGTPRKLLDVSHLSSIGWRLSVSLKEGIGRTYADFLRHHALELK